MIRSVIIDDEQNGRSILQTYITKYCTGIEVVAQADSVKSGVETIETFKPDLVFLDIQMQDGTGFDLLTKLSNRNFKLIFVTSFDHYAIKAIRFSAVDYLLKPLDPDLLIDAINRVKEMICNSSEMVDVLLNNRKKLEHLVLNNSNSTNVVNINDIVRCEANSNYTFFYMQNNKRIVVSKTMKNFEMLLDDERFLKVHRSNIININYVERFENGNNGMLFMTDGSCIEVSRRNRNNLKEYLLSHKSN